MISGDGKFSSTAVSTVVLLIFINGRKCYMVNSATSVRLLRIKISLFVISGSNSVVLDRGPETSAVKSYLISTFGFVGYLVSVAATQLCHMKAAVDSTSVSDQGCVSIKLYLDKQAEVWTWPMGHCLLTPFLNETLLSRLIPHLGRQMLTLGLNH